MESAAPAFTQFNDLASEQVGGNIIFATDDWFATAENLLKANKAEWRETEFTEFGKWMDGWESRRKRIPGHDWCIVQLGAAGVIEGVDVDTSYFSGNYTPCMSIQAACLTEGPPSRTGDRMGTKATEREFQLAEKLGSEHWTTLVERRELKPGYPETCHNYFSVSSKERWTHVRLNMFPDGGIARLRVYGRVVPDWSTIKSDQQLDLLAMLNGGVCTGYSNAHYGHARNITNPGRARIMAEGWETARRLDRPAILEADVNGVLIVPGCEWATFELGHTGKIKKIEIDTNHFKGNFPDSCLIEGCLVKNAKQPSEEDWKVLLPPQKLEAHKQHYYTDVNDIGTVSHVKVTMAPDGGISRLRLWGYKQ